MVMFGNIVTITTLTVTTLSDVTAHCL